MAHFQWVADSKAAIYLRNESSCLLDGLLCLLNLLAEVCGDLSSYLAEVVRELFVMALLQFSLPLLELGLVLLGGSHGLDGRICIRATRCRGHDTEV